MVASWEELFDSEYDKAVGASNRRDYASAEQSYLKLLELCEQASQNGAEDVDDVILVRTGLSGCYYSTNKLAAAAKCDRETLRLLTSQWRSRLAADEYVEHEVNVRHKLARDLSARHDKESNSLKWLKESVKLHRENLSIYSAKPETKGLSNTQFSLAFDLVKLGRATTDKTKANDLYGEAADLGQSYLAAAEKGTESNSTRTIEARYNYASALYHLQQYTQAKDLFLSNQDRINRLPTADTRDLARIISATDKYLAACAEATVDLSLRITSRRKTRVDAGNATPTANRVQSTSPENRARRREESGARLRSVAVQETTTEGNVDVPRSRRHLSVKPAKSAGVLSHDHKSMLEPQDGQTLRSSSTQSLKTANSTAAPTSRHRAVSDGMSDPKADVATSSRQRHAQPYRNAAPASSLQSRDNAESSISIDKAQNDKIMNKKADAISIIKERSARTTAAVKAHKNQTSPIAQAQQSSAMDREHRPHSPPQRPRRSEGTKSSMSSCPNVDVSLDDVEKAPSPQHNRKTENRLSASKDGTQRSNRPHSCPLDSAADNKTNNQKSGKRSSISKDATERSSRPQNAPLDSAANSESNDQESGKRLSVPKDATERSSRPQSAPLNSATNIENKLSSPSVPQLNVPGSFPREEDYTLDIGTQPVPAITRSLSSGGLSISSGRSGRLYGDPALVPDADSWFSDIRQQAHVLLEYSDIAKVRQRKRTKIAILDSGFDHDYVRNSTRSNVCYHRSRFKMYKDFLNRPSKWVDSDPGHHGTYCAVLAQQVATQADIYIANVVYVEKEERHIPEEAVVKALEWALSQNVDIISMSFGFNSWSTGIHEQINRAREQGVLLFAAASNYGDRAPEYGVFPAWAPTVFCICSATPSGKRSDFNPRHNDEKLNFMLLGEGIAILKEHEKEPLVGTSFATPLAAGTAALVLDLLHFFGVAHKYTKFSSCLRTYEGMGAVFKEMSGSPTYQNGVYYHVKPWNVLYPEKDLLGDIEGAPDVTPLWLTMQELKKCLARFGKDLYKIPPAPTPPISAGVARTE